jgi:hypothetical protein
MDLAGSFAGVRLFRGEIYAARCYYLTGAGTQEKAVAEAIATTIKARAPEDLKVKAVQTKGKIGGALRTVIVARWGIGHGYVVCFAAGADLFVSVRVNFVPGCLVRALHLFRPVQPSIFGLDDLNMLFFCVTRSVEESLDGLRLAYLSQ